MKIPVFYTSAVCLLVATTAAIAQSQGTILVANQTDRSVSFIDVAAGREVATLPENATRGHEITTSPDGRTAYVPIYGSSGVGSPGTDGSQMLVIDVPTHAITSTVDFGHGVRPHLPVYDTHRNVLYVSTELDEAITAIDPKTLKILYKIPTGAKESHMFTLSHDGRFAYTTNVGATSVSVLDLDSHKTAAVIPLGDPGSFHVQRISISNDDKLIFTSDWDKPRLAVIDTATRKLKQWIDLPGTGYGSVSTKDGKYLILCLSKSSKVAVIDLAKMAVVQTIDVPAQPQEVILRPDGKVAYVSCNTDHKVAAIDTTTWKVQSVIDAGKGADGLTWVPASASTHAGGN